MLEGESNHPPSSDSGPYQAELTSEFGLLDQEDMAGTYMELEAPRYNIDRIREGYESDVAPKFWLGSLSIYFPYLERYGWAAHVNEDLAWPDIAVSEIVTVENATETRQELNSFLVVHWHSPENDTQTVNPVVQAAKLSDQYRKPKYGAVSFGLWVTFYEWDSQRGIYVPMGKSPNVLHLERQCRTVMNVLLHIKYNH